MKQRVGIPRAMGYYYLYPFFRTLLEELGAEPVLSPLSNQRLIDGMDCCPTDEPCLPVKLHFSHADTLANREDIDFLFLPIIIRVNNSHCCPKFVGIADMIRHGLQLPESRVLMPIVDYTSDKRKMVTALLPLARRLGVRDRKVLERAIIRGQQKQEYFHQVCIDRQITTPEAYRLVHEGVQPAIREWPATAPTIAVIGHPYLIYEVISQGMIERLRGYGRVITAEMVDPAAIAEAMSTIPEGVQLWPFEAMLLGGALHLMRAKKVDKLILVGSFECGPESIIESYVEEEARLQGTPLMVLALDEHSGEAGLTTRLEAFMDTDKLDSLSPPLPAPPPLTLPREEMVLGMPSMGNLDLAVRALVEDFGIRMMPTPRATAQCIELGREIAPEFACFPFTATLGQMRLLLDQGANTLLMVGGKGFCRLGWYAQVQEALLRKLGYDFRMFIIDSPFPLHVKGQAFQRTLQSVTGSASLLSVLAALRTSYTLLRAMDEADMLAHRLRAYERVAGTANKLQDSQLRRLAKTFEMSAINRLAREFREEVSAVDTEETDPLRIRIAGEIWVVLEQSATREVERWLGARNRPRVLVEREHSSSFWFRSHVLRERTALRREEAIAHAAKPWLSQKVGGHGLLTVGQVALAKEEKMDGVLHIFPFTCMPEIIAHNILVRVSQELDIPVLTYIVSEQTGEAGMETRLESFVDLLDERRQAFSMA